MNALRHAFGDEFRRSLSAPLAGISAASALSALASVPWATVGPIAASLVTGIGGAIVGLRTQRQLSRIRVEREAVKLEMERLELAAFRKKVEGTRPEDLHPEEIGHEVREREHEQGQCAASGPGDPAHP